VNILKTVYKYKLDFVNKQILTLPVGAQILSVTNQQENIVLYAMVDTDVKEFQSHTIYVHGTGHIIYGENPAFKEALAFIGTVVLSGGALVFHVFTGKGE